jgi:hypothetical protein
MVIDPLNHRMRSARAKPTEFAMPWPSGPVVVSIPSACLYSGAGSLAVDLAEPLQLVQGSRSAPTRTPPRRNFLVEIKCLPGLEEGAHFGADSQYDFLTLAGILAPRAAASDGPAGQDLPS